MADTYEPTSLEEYLTTPVESSADASAASEVQADDPALDADQSGAAAEDLQPDADAAQPDESETPENDSGSDADAASPDQPAAFNWDAPENPYLADAQQLREIRALAERQQAEQAAAKERERLLDVGKRLMEVDESDLPQLMGDFIEEVSDTAIQPVLQQVNTLNHGLTALVAAVQTLPPAVQEQVKKTAAEYRELGSTAEEIERAFGVSQRERTAASAREAEMQKQIKALTAQLAAKTIQESGANRAETVAVGGGGNDEPTSWRDLLGGGPL